MNVDILGISELKWTGMGEFNSDDHYIYYCGQESLRRNGVAIMVIKKSLKCSTWMHMNLGFINLDSLTSCFPSGSFLFHFLAYYPDLEPRI